MAAENLHRINTRSPEWTLPILKFVNLKYLSSHFIDGRYFNSHVYQITKNNNYYDIHIPAVHGNKILNR